MINIKLIQNRDFKFIKEILTLTTYEKIIRLINTFSRDNSSFYFEPNKKYNILKKTTENEYGFSRKYNRFKKSVECIQNIKFSHSTNDFFCFKNSTKDVIKINKNNLLYVIYR